MVRINELFYKLILILLKYSDTTGFKKKYANFLGQFKNLHPRLMTDAYWCRDQNFRKYFEIRKRHGIEPSVEVNTFYNKDKERDYYNAHSTLNKLIKNDLNSIKQ